jgi:hypothetical protein
MSQEIQVVVLVSEQEYAYPTDTKVVTVSSRVGQELLSTAGHFSEMIRLVRFAIAAAIPGKMKMIFRLQKTRKFSLNSSSILY